MPWIAPGHMQSDHVSSWSTWKVDSPRKIPPGLDSICESLGSSPTKADKMDIVGFLQRVRTSLYCMTCVKQVESEDVIMYDCLLGNLSVLLNCII